MPSASCPLWWPRAILLVDMNAFFASIEQLDYPELRGRPVAVTNGMLGTCMITSSYEARRFGIKTGMHIKEGRRRCPELIQRPSRPERYIAVSTAIMAALDVVSPELEVFSVDEAFLDVTDCQGVHGTPVRMGQMARRIVWETSGLLCSVGVSGDKTTAKYAAKLQKPNGFVVIPPWEAQERLKAVPVTELCGIKKGIGRYLAERGVFTCGDMAELPISELGRRFGNPGRRIWLMAQRLDPEPIHTEVKAPQRVGASKVTPPATKTKALLASYLQHMAELVALRMRHHGYEAQLFSVGILTSEGFIDEHYRSARPTDDGLVINRFCHDLLDRLWHGQGIHQVSVVALDPKPRNQQEDFFSPIPEKRRQLNAVIDRINDKYKRFTILPANLLNRSHNPDVIAPSWKPTGHRQTI